ncbi:MAG: CopG family transcriptional regulator [Patescibacteria group bacterium]
MPKIEISDELYQKIQEKIKNLPEYKSADEYVAKILEKELKEKDKEVYSQEEEKKIKERLKGLGYLD